MGKARPARSRVTPDWTPKGVCASRYTRYGNPLIPSSNVMDPGLDLGSGTWH